MSAPPPPPACVVVIGGGFAGLDAVRTLSANLPSSSSLYLLDVSDHFQFLPAVPEVLGGALELADISVKFDGHKSLGTKTSFVLCESIEAVSASDQTVTYTPREASDDPSSKSTAAPVTLTFTHCILATGCSYPSPVKQLPLLCSKASLLSQLHSKIVGSPDLPLLVAGGGHAGTEVVCELANRYPSKRIVFCTGSGGLLPGHTAGQIAYAMKHFTRMCRNVDVREERVSLVSPGPSGDNPGPSVRVYRTSSTGEEIATDVYVDCTGFGTANLDFLSADFARTDKGHAKVDTQTHQVTLSTGATSSTIFAAGDCREKANSSRTAAAAHGEGRFAARQVLRSLSSRPLRAASSNPSVVALSLGPADGLFMAAGKTVMWGRPVLVARKAVRVGWNSVMPLAPSWNKKWLDGKVK